MNKWHLKKIMTVFVIFSMAIVAGCQSVGGLDINQVLKNVLKVKSAEGTYQIDFKLNLNMDELKKDLIDSESELSSEELEELDESLELIKQFTNIKLVIDQYKVKNNVEASYKGSITFGNQEKIGFKIIISEKLAVIDLDGAKRTIAIDLTEEYDEDLDESIDTEVEESLVKAVNEISELITDYSISKLPNIERLKVTNETANINDENIELMMVRGDLQGIELWNWFKKLIDALLVDREAIEELIGQILTIYDSSLQIFGEPTWNAIGLYNSYSPYDLEYLDEEVESNYEEQVKPLSNDELTKQFVDSLFEMLEELKVSMADVETNEKEELNQIFNDSLKIGFEYGVDASLNTRQQNFILDYNIHEAYKDEFLTGTEGFSLRINSTLWNINGDVTVEEPKTSLSSVYIEDMANMHGFEVANLFVKGSFIDSILRDQLHITRQYYFNFASDSDDSVYLNENKQAMIPLREIAEKFGARLTYDAAVQQVKVYDVATDTNITVQVGSDVANINGKNVKWSAKVERKNGVIFVPARSFAEALGAEIDWNNMGYIEIVREP